MLDYSINVGIIIQTAMVIGGGLIGFGVFKRMIVEMETEMKEIKKDQKDLTKTVAQIAVQDSRLDRLEQDLRDLRRGDGWIINQKVISEE